MAVQITCQTCGYTTNTATQGRAEYAIARHSCTKHLEAAARRARTVRRYQQTAITKPCTHKTHHPHGTNARAALDGCKCQPCRDAAYRATKQWRARVATRGHVYVDATPARDHIRRLQDAGLGWKRIADLAGVANTSVYALLYGRRGKPPSTKARRETITKILAVPMPSVDDLGARVPVDATGTRRRLQALATQGWTLAQLAARAGLPDRQAVDRAMRASTTSAGTARTIRALYDQLWNQRPTPANRHEQAAITRTIRYAKKQGWAPPLAWDDDTIDDPDAAPDTGEHARRGADLDEYLFLVRAGETPYRAAQRLGVTLSAIEQQARRTGRTDVLTTLSTRSTAA